MKNIMRALRMYAKAIHPFALGFGLFMMIVMALVFIIDPDPVGSEDYLEMLGVVQIGSIGIFFVIMTANVKIQQNKFYSSCINAKELFIYGPLITAAVIKMLYDAVLDVAAYINLGTAGLSDMLIVSTISTFLVIIVCSCYGKNGVPFISVISFIGYIALLFLLNSMVKIPAANKLIGHPLWVAVIVVICGYIISIAAALILENIWWKKGIRFAMPNKLMQNMLGGQENE